MSDPEHNWTFLSHHAHVLLTLAEEPDARLRDIADRVGITERSVQSIVTDLAASGALTRVRNGRRNHYILHPSTPLRHPIEAHRTVGSLIALVRSPKLSA